MRWEGGEFLTTELVSKLEKNIATRSLHKSVKFKVSHSLMVGCLRGKIEWNERIFVLVHIYKGFVRSLWLFHFLFFASPHFTKLTHPCECMYTWFWWCQKKNQTKLLQRISMASRLIQDCFNKQSLASRLTQAQALP